jgi:hypothetical protein
MDTHHEFRVPGSHHRKDESSLREDGGHDKSQPRKFTGEDGDILKFGDQTRAEHTQMVPHTEATHLLTSPQDQAASGVCRVLKGVVYKEPIGSKWKSHPPKKTQWPLVHKRTIPTE